MSPRLSTIRSKLGYIDEDGIYVVPDGQTRREIMRLFMFMHDNKNDHISKQQIENSRSVNRSTGRMGGDMFSFKPKIAPKSRNMAENYKRTFADRLTNLLSDQSMRGEESSFA